MNIETFIAQMNGEHKEGIIEKHIIRQYVPIEEKIAQAKKIVEMSCYKDMINAEGEPQKIYWEDSITLHILTIRALIGMYTDLTFSDNPIKDYNMLAEKKYIEKIIGALPADDVVTFNNIVDMVHDDEYENINSIQGRFKNLSFGFESALQKAIMNIVTMEVTDNEEQFKEYTPAENKGDI